MARCCVSEGAKTTENPAKKKIIFRRAEKNESELSTQKTLVKPIHEVDSEKAANKHMEEIHCCRACGKTFDCSSAFRQHSTICARSFVESSGDTETKRPLKCTVCKKRFVNMQTAGKHVKEVHLQPANFTCHVCGKVAVFASSLKRHLLVHFGKKELTCDICDKKFVRELSLTNHVKRHLSATNVQFACPEVACSKKFLMRKDLNFHLETKHLSATTNNVEFACPEVGCCKKFFMPKNLKFHLKRKHEKFLK